MKKIICSTLALLMAISPLSALALADAAPIGTTPVKLTIAPLTFKATVPTGLPFDLDAAGVTTPASEASIINGTMGPIKVVSVATTPEGTWTLTNYTDDFTSKKVNSKDLALQLNTDNVQTNGGITLTPQNWPTIEGNGNLRLDYQGKFAPQETAITAATVAHVSFVLDWDDAVISEADIEDTYNPEHSFTSGDIKTINFSFKDSKSDKVVFESSNPEVATVELVDTSRLRLVSGIKQAKITALSNGTTTITGTLEDGTKSSIEVTVTNKAVKGLVVKSFSDKTTYLEGEDFDATGLVIEAVNNNGTSETVSDYTLSNNTNLTANQTEVILSYSGYEISLPITVVAKSVTSISVTTPPNKTVYSQKSKFNDEGLKLRINYNNNTTEEVASGWTIINGTNLATGLTSVVIDYKGQTINVPITVDKYILADDSDFSGATDGSFKYIGTDKYVEVPHVINGIPITSYKYMFTETSVEGVKSTNKNVTDLSWMFYNSQATTLDLSSFDTSKVTNMSCMFYDSQATTLDLSKFNTSEVINMNAMFAGSKATTLDLSSFDTSNVRNMSVMFNRSQATELDLSNFDTSSVIDMQSMFNWSKATELDLSSFNTSNVTNMYTMFYNSQVTTLDLSNFDTSNVTNMYAMFSYSQATTLDLSSFDTANITYMDEMFTNSQATTGYARTLSDAKKFNESSDKPARLVFKLK